MSIKYESNFSENKLTVALKGELDYATADDLKKYLNGEIDKHDGDLVIDLNSLDYIDSTGIGVLVGVLKRLKTNEKSIALINPKDNVRKIFNITGLNKIFNMEG